MLIRYLQLRGPISEVRQWPTSVMEKIPTPAEHQAIQLLVDDLKKFKSVSKKLQSGGTETVDLSKARALFAALVKDFGIKYPLSHIRETSNIINNSDFENGVIKILEKRESLLTEDEKKIGFHLFKI
jgi:hypothetical protein